MFPRILLKDSPCQLLSVIDKYHAESRSSPAKLHTGYSIDSFINSDVVKRPEKRSLFWCLKEEVANRTAASYFSPNVREVMEIRFPDFKNLERISGLRPNG